MLVGAIVRGAAVALALLPAPAAAQMVPQGGPEAERIREVLRGIRLPEGFRIGLHALVPGARHMAVAPAGGGGGAIFVGTRTDRVWAVIDRDGDGRAEEVRAFAPGLRFDMPNGPCFAPDGTLVVPELNRVRAFSGAAARLAEETPAAVELVPPGGLVPAEEALPNHVLRVCSVGPEGRLYLALGQPYDVPPPEKLPLYERLGMGGIVRMSLDGQNREVFARGIRNSVGIAFRPGTRELWFTDTDSNGLGDDLPPGEINRAAAPGLHFGFPWYGGGRVRTEEFRDSVPPPEAVFPVVETAAHATDLGLAFHEGPMFPPEYRGALFSAQRGSSVRGTPVGARVMVTFLAPDGSARGHRPFAEGWLDEGTGAYRGRIVDVAVLPDGSLLVSDDEAGALYRITHGAAR
jgi:glucose/arabinose dehydrogenase